MQRASGKMKTPKWPLLVYDDWKETRETLHLWTQVVGKIRLSKEPWANHSWYSTLYLTSRGLGTSAISDGEKVFSLEFDFLDHQLLIQSSERRTSNLHLRSESVASFYSRVMDALKEMGIQTMFDLHPNEVADVTPFNEDTRSRIYSPEQAWNYWQVLVRVNNVFKQFRAEFVGKCSPVHFFWGSFDLAVTRFSGRRAPEHPGHVPHLSDRVAKEAYSHEVSSCGFWPGNDAYPHAAFYSYAYPAPADFAIAEISPKEAFFNQSMREFILPYDAVRNSLNPEETLFSFLQSTYEAAANLGTWDRALLEESAYRTICEKGKLAA
jgi:hypothetical protein